MTVQLPSRASLGARPIPQNRQGIAQQDTASAGQGIAQIGAALGQVGEELHKINEKKRLAQSQLNLTLANNQIYEAHDEISRGLSDGTIATDRANQAFSDKFSAIRDKTLQGLRRHEYDEYDKSLQLTGAALQRSLSANVFKRGQSEIAGAIDQFGEQAQRDASRIGPALASDKFSAFVDFNGDAAGLTEQQKQKIKQSAAERIYYGHFDRLGNEALTQGNVQALQELRKQISGPEGEPIDPIKRTQLNHQLFGFEQSIEAKRRAAQNAVDRDKLAKENSAVDLYNKTIDLMVNGNQLNPEFIRELTLTAEGTRMQAPVGQLLSRQTEIAGFATRTAPERTAILERWRNRAADPKKGTDPDEAAMLRQLTSVNDKVNAAAKENPWTAAQGAGVLTDAPAFDFNNLNTAFAAIDYRMRSIGALEAWAGAKVSPMQPQEVQQLTGALKAMPVEQQADFLGELGSRIGDPRRIALVADQLANNSKPMELMLKLNDKTSAGRSVSALVGLGAQSLADKTVKRDETALSGWRSEIAEMIRGTLGDKSAEDAAIDAAYYVRAALESPANAAPGYSMKVSNENAVKLVVGQPMERAGVKTVLPRGMDENQFTEKLREYARSTLPSVVPDGTVYVRGQPVKLPQLANRLPTLGMRRNPMGGYTPVSGGAFVTLDQAGTVPMNIEVR